MTFNHPIAAIARLTALELIQNRAMQSLIALLLLFPVLAFVFSNLFMMDIGKVYVDALAGISHLTCITFILFFVTPLMAKDIELKICYYFVVPPVSREQYIMGRFGGILVLFVLLLLVLSISGMACAWLVLKNNFVMHQSGLTLLSIPELLFFQFFHYIGLIGVTFFIFSWATGMAEIMLFTFAVTFLTWFFPPIILALQNPDVAKEMPLWLTGAVNLIYQLLPHLNGSEIALSIAHAEPIQPKEVALYCIEHISYAIVTTGCSLLLFRRRDL